MKYAEVYTSIKTLEVDHPFDYSVPEGMSDSIHPGSMVLVPFGKRQEIGFVTKIKDSTDVSIEILKPVSEVISKIPVFDRQKLKLIYWMSRYYLQPFSKTVEFLLPPGNKDKVISVFRSPGDFFRYESVVYLNRENTAGQEEIYRSCRSTGQQRILDFLKKSDGMELKLLLKETGISRSSVSALQNKDLIKVEKTRINDWYEYGIDSEDTGDPQEEDLKQDEKKHMELLKIRRCISGRLPGTFILYDFDPEKKSNIYMLLCKYAIKSNKKVLILTPETGDAEHLYCRMSGAFLMGKIVVYHSELKESEQLSKWYDIYCGNIDIIIGNRSAIFLPLADIGLVIVDDEHDPSYKESTMVRYNAGDIALRMCRDLKIPLLFTSNTPSMRLWYKAGSDSSFNIIKPAESFFHDNDVSKEMLDLKAVDTFMEDINITNRLHRIIKSEISEGNKALVFFNKRGYSRFLICGDCGSIPQCPRCNISYSYHSSSRKLVCHHCSHAEDFEGRCRNCGSSNMLFKGTGIERIEYKLKQRFKDVRVVRMDSDLAKNRQSVKDFWKLMDEDGPLIILGTQMILKDKSVKDLTAAAVVNYDSLFQLPDFQVNERVFQLLVQIFSRIKNIKRSVFIIQAFNTGNDVLDSFISGDYEYFYKKELDKRKDLYYPPFSSLINIIVSGKDNDSVSRDIKSLAEKISGISRIKFFMLGPAPAPFNRIKLNYRWHILIKTDSVIRFNNNLRNVLKDFKKSEDNKIVFDVDPVWIL